MRGKILKFFLNVWVVGVWVGFDVFKMKSSREVLKKNIKFNVSKYLKRGIANPSR
jgi:hypothetical protein